jgi:hypothetical protein
MIYVAQNDEPGSLARLLGDGTRRAAEAVASVLAALVVAVVVSQPAHGQELREPTDAELRTAYCIAYLNQEIPALPSILTYAQRAVTSATPEDVGKRQLEVEQMQAEVARQQTTLRRLQSYLLPKLTVLDPSAICLAKQRAVEDFKEQRAPTPGSVKSPECMKEQRTQTSTSAKSPEYIIAKSPEYMKEQYKRTIACFEPEHWFPF